MKYIFGNWKMYLDAEESRTLIEELTLQTTKSTDLSVAVFPTALSFADVHEAAKKSWIAVGAQNVAWVPKGAYTGAVSALLYKESGATHALVGHSERRYIFGETNEDVRKKIEACLDVGITPVVCIGETKEDASEGKREYRLKKQLMKAFEGLDLSDSSIMVAYEPVWAIGTDNPCNPEDVYDSHVFIKKELLKYTDKEIPVLYGGSVSPKNVASFISLENVDGVLVGHASSVAKDFMDIISAAEKL